jgi:phage terminase large subunit-like protein
LPRRTRCTKSRRSGDREPFARRPGEALHPEREPPDTLERIRRTIGEYNFAGQYQQTPAPLGGGLVKAQWFKRYGENEPESFDRIVQSWDTANKATELSDFSVCTSWGIRGKHLFLLDVLRRRLEYPALKRAVREQHDRFKADVVLIEDKASGTQLIQELTPTGAMPSPAKAGRRQDHAAARADREYRERLCPPSARRALARRVSSRDDGVPERQYLASSADISAVPSAPTVRCRPEKVCIDPVPGGARRRTTSIPAAGCARPASGRAQRSLGSGKVFEPVEELSGRVDLVVVLT